MIFNNLSDILNYLPTCTLTFHWQISRKRSKVFNNYQTSICDQVHLQKFWCTWSTWTILKKKNWIQITTFKICTVILWKVLWDQKFAEYLSFALINFCNLPLRKNSVRQTFVNTKILFLSILTINSGFQHEYLTSYITLSGKKSNILFTNKTNLTINAFLWKKWLLEKEKKN